MFYCIDTKNENAPSFIINDDNSVIESMIIKEYFLFFICIAILWKFPKVAQLTLLSQIVELNVHYRFYCAIISTYLLSLIFNDKFFFNLDELN
jgi:hypothetical protein